MKFRDTIKEANLIVDRNTTLAIYKDWEGVNAVKPFLKVISENSYGSKKHYTTEYLKY
jgi:hypothetical protein